jgi:hypothetical protein
MEFKGDEIFLTENGIYEYTGVVHDDKKVYGRLANTDKEEECFNFSEVLSVWQEVGTGEKQCNLPVVTHRFITSIAEQYDIEPSKIVIGSQYGVLVVQKYDEGAADKWETLALFDPNGG